MSDLVAAFVEVLVGDDSILYPDLRGQLLPRAWRVSVGIGVRTVPIGFARQKDAEAAKRALEAAGIVSVEDFKRVGRPVFERVMIEALNW